MRNRCKPISMLIVLTLLLLVTATAFADGTSPSPTAIGAANDTTTYLFNVNGYWIAETPFQYVLTTMGYAVCQALLWCN